MTPARHFIDERLAEAWKEIDADFLLWTSRKKHPNLEFSGSIAEQFWGKSLKSYAATLTATAFRASREIADEHRLDAAECAQTAGDAVENALHRLITSMVRIDRLLRGKGFPDSITERDGSFPLQHCLQRLADKTAAEVDAARSRSRHSVSLPLSSDHGVLWFWLHADYRVRWAVAASVAGLVISSATAGFFAGKNEFFRRSAELFDDVDSKTPPIHQPTAQPNPAPPAAISSDTTTAPTTTHTNKSN